MKVGVWLPNFGSWAPIKKSTVEFNKLRELAEAADRLGFSSIWVSDHLMNPAGAKPSGGPVENRPILEAWTTLSALSTVTRKVKLGNLVLCNQFRIPSLLAKMGATLDVISNGRFILNIGVGWFRKEAVAYGIPWRKYMDRYKALREAVKVIKELWTKDVANFEGEYYTLKNAVLEPKPLSKPRPPIWMGGKSDNILRLVAEEGDGWDIDVHQNVLSTIKERVESLKLYCRTIGRRAEEIEISTHAMALVTESEDEALELAKPHAESANLTLKECSDIHFVGTPKKIIKKIKRYSEVGVTNLCLLFGNDVEGLMHFADEVLPAIMK